MCVSSAAAGLLPGAGGAAGPTGLAAALPVFLLQRGGSPLRDSAELGTLLAALYATESTFYAMAACIAAIVADERFGLASPSRGKTCFIRPVVSGSRSRFPSARTRETPRSTRANVGGVALGLAPQHHR